MADRHFLARLKNNTPEGGDGIIVRRNLAPSQVNVSGATRAVASNSKPVDVVVFDAANESVVINFPIPIDFDRTSGTLKAAVVVALVSGTSLDVNLDTLTAVRAGEATLAAGVAAITPPTTTATQLDTAGEVVTVEFDLTDTLADLTDPLVPGDVLAVEIDAEALAGSGVAHVYGAYVEYASMIVANDFADRR